MKRNRYPGKQSPHLLGGAIAIRSSNIVCTWFVVKDSPPKLIVAQGAMRGGSFCWVRIAEVKQCGCFPFKGEEVCRSSPQNNATTEGHARISYPLPGLWNAFVCKQNTTFSQQICKWQFQNIVGKENENQSRNEEFRKHPTETKS